MNEETTTVGSVDQNITVAQRTDFPADMLGFTAGCAFTIAFFGTLGNLLTIFALPMSKKLRTTATAFVINLAVVELMFCIFILPMSGAQYAYLSYESEPLLSNKDCVFFALARYTFTQVEIQTILAIALTRAIAVGCPRFYQKIDNGLITGIYISIIWTYSFFLKLATALGKFGSYIFNPVTMECDMARDPFSIYARIILTLIEAIIPVFLILVLYVFIFIMIVRRGMTRKRKFSKPTPISTTSIYVKKSSMRVAKGAHKSPKPSLASTTSSSTSEEASNKDEGGRKASITSFKSLKKMMSDSSLKARLTRRSSSTCLPSTSRRDMRVARMIFIIFMMVIICSVPVMVIHIIDHEVKEPRRFLVVHILYWLQYSLNVVVYVLMNRQYREAYIDLVAKILPSWERHKTFVFPWENPSISSRPPQGLHSSLKRKDSASQDPSGTTKEYRPVDAVQYTKGGRLSAILEVNSSSYASNDDVFLDEKKIKAKNYKNDLVNDKPINGSEKQMMIMKTHNQEEDEQQEEKPEEKQHWISQNGGTKSSLSKEEDVV